MDPRRDDPEPRLDAVVTPSVESQGRPDDGVDPRRVFVTQVGLLTAILAVAATVVCTATAFMSTVDVVWFAPALLVVLAYRWWFERLLVREGRSVRVGLAFAVHALACAGLVAMHPLFGVYAFSGYLDAPRALAGARRWAGVTAMACVLSFSQIGGLVAQWATWPVYLAFVAVNLAIATTMSLADESRERANRRRVETVERLLAAEKENAALQARLAEQAREAGVLAERARLSREIHDTVAQGLVGIVRQLDAVDDADPRVAKASTTAREALAEARRAVAALASPRLDDDDLPAALDRLVTSWEGAGVDVRFVLDGDPQPTPHDAVVLRLVQEGLANLRHAAATRAVVTLTYGDSLRLDIRDDGRGFDPVAPVEGHGLAGMRQRVMDAGGTIDVEAAPGEGCTISADLPLPCRREPDASFAIESARTGGFSHVDGEEPPVSAQGVSR